ncbi:conserved hypothetical protein [Methanolacinia petrolearia DSM 11571]|uniref:Uncharacterized protein n=1 Tax=Methanolacinia petrolearia (strain DSM 11571 / OCM 486 / SEBR 4847) TaxID=679926 RepID=E1RG68_METP4|nr:conserved hypothetical protein [Methanolacinia petrolearia DSM 11571]
MIVQEHGEKYYYITIPYFQPGADEEYTSTKPLLKKSNEKVSKRTGLQALKLHTDPQSNPSFAD